jgi:hypothetical protein
MLVSPSAAAPTLVTEVAALSADADAMPMPVALLDGWASFAALEYQAAVERLTVGLLHMRAALRNAASALEAGR